MTWQPIETAPRDGSTFLIFDIEDRDAEIGFGWCLDGTFYGHTPSDIYGAPGELSGAAVWMPLPSPPSAERGK